MSLADTHAGPLVAELSAALQSVEWAGTETDEWGVVYNACPSCQGGDPDDLATPPEERGHRDGCRLLAALSKAGAL